MQKAKAEVLNFIFGRTPDPLLGHRERIEEQQKKAKRTKLGRYRVQILLSYLVARGDDLDALKKIARREADLLGADHMVELIDLHEFKFLKF